MNTLTSLVLVAVSGLAAFTSPLQRSENVVEVMVAAGNFKALLAAAEAADLVQPLIGKGPITILAPSDEAFAKLGKDAVKELMDPRNKEVLVQILRSHMISGRLTAADGLKGKGVETLAGSKVAFSLERGRLLINGEVNVVGNDVPASNGIIHVIDQVLIPARVGPVGRLVIGFFSEKPGEQLARYLGVNAAECLLVTEITEASEAQTAGLRAFDLILSINGRKASSEVIKSEKERAGFGGAVAFSILRRGAKMTIHSKVGAEGQ